MAFVQHRARDRRNRYVPRRASLTPARQLKRALAGNCTPSDAATGQKRHQSARRKDFYS